MKTNRFLLVWLFSLLFLCGLNAQTFRQTIDWKGVQTLTTENGQEQVLDFNGSISMPSSDLPYYMTKIDVSDNFSLDDYTVSIDNVRLAPLSDAEKQVLVHSAGILPESVLPEVELVADGYKKQLKITFMPVLQRGDSYRRVSSFDINLQKKSSGSQPMRAAAGLQIYPETLPSAITGEGYWARLWMNDATLGIGYTFSVTAGQLPDGLDLVKDAWGIYLQNQFDQNIGEWGDYVPVVSHGKFTITATNGTNTVSREYEIVSGCASIYLQNPQSNAAACGVYSGGQFVFADNNTGNPVTLSEPFSFALVGAVPEGLTISANGFLQGTVTLPQTGVQVRATTASGCNYDAFITITNNSVRLDNTALRMAIAEASYEDWLTATGGTAPYTYAATGLPQGLSISASGKISGTTATSGSFPVAVTVTDNAGCSQTVNYVLTVSGGSVLASGNWFKIRIPETGNYTGDNINYVPEKRMYKLTYEQLKAMDGIDPDQDIHIFGYGGAMLRENTAALITDGLPELPVYMEKGADGVFNAGDYILFYTQGPVSWTITETTFSDKTTGKEYLRTRNPYSNYGYYFVASGLGTPTLTAPVTQEDTSKYPDGTIDSYPIRILHENESVNLAESGRNWYGEKYVMPPDPAITTSSKFFNIVIPDYKPSTPIYIRASAVACNSTPSAASENVMRIYTNTPTAPAYVMASNASAQFNHITKTEQKAAELKTPLIAKYTTIGNNTSFGLELRYMTSNKASDVAAWLDYFTITAQSKLVMRDDQLAFDATDVRQSYNNMLFTIDNVSNPATVVWDVTNPQQAVQMAAQTTASQLGFMAQMDRMRSFVAFNPKGNFPTPESVGKVENQNLQAAKNVDYVIISPQDFVTAAESLANAHRTMSNLNVEVVTPEQVFNEFSSGTPDATAFRRLMKHVYNTSPASRAKYLLLFGDGTYNNRAQTDNKNLHNYILTYQVQNSLNTIDSYLTDDYFGLINGTESLGEQYAAIDVGVGRIPANTALQASGVVNKLIAYMDNTAKGDWKKLVAVVADDNSQGESYIHIGQADNFANLTSQLYPKIEIEKIYIDAYKQQTSGGGESYPQAREKLQNLVKNGLMLLDYVGHGGTDKWTNEAIMTNSDVVAMTNKNQGFWVTATCESAVFDNPAVINGACIAENAILNPNGASIGLFTTTRVVYSEYNNTINRSFVQNVFQKDEQGNRLRVGDTYRLAKRAMAAAGNTYLMRNSLSYVLLGDPALTLTYPEYDVVADSFMINGQPAADGDVTLSGLDVVEIKGHISDNGLLLSDFNGTLQLDLFDKIVTKQTLKNHNEATAFSFEDRDKILSAKTEVANGEFSVVFMMPRNISPTMGDGRISYYASSETSDIEAYGISENFNVGGMGDAELEDEEGPAMTIYLNDPSFVSGSKVNETPTFYAELFDENGINYSGSSSIFCIGCDMKIILDNATEYIVNDYFTPDMGSYTSGKVTYQFPPLAPGKYHLVFTARDMLNNSSRAMLEFEVVEGLSVFQVKAYPNPAKDFTTFGIEYNQPDASQFDIKVYDLTGRLVYAGTQAAVPENYVTESDWKLTSSNGQRLSPGVYLYNAEVTTKSGKTRSKTQRIIIQ